MIAQQESDDDDLVELARAINRLCVDLGMVHGAEPRRAEPPEPQPSGDILVRVPRPVASYLMVGQQVNVSIYGVRYAGRISKILMVQGGSTTAKIGVAGFRPSPYFGSGDAVVTWPTRRKP